jgi:hypothetical protein
LEPTWSGNELGAWSRLGAGASLELGAATSLELGVAGAGPTQDPSKHFFLCLFCLFVCGVALHKIRSVAMQLHKQHLLLLLCVARKEEEESNGIAFFFFFVQRKKFQRIRVRSSELLLFVSLFFLLFLLAPLRFF